MTLPITPYRWFNGKDVFNNSRVLRGIEHLMTDNGRYALGQHEVHTKLHARKSLFCSCGRARSCHLFSGRGDEEVYNCILVVM